MNKETGTVTFATRQAILDEINSLLATSGGIDENRAKKVRKAIENLRGSDTASDAGENQQAAEQPAADSGLDAEIDTALETLRTRIHTQVERRNHDYEKSLALMKELEAALKHNELQQAERAHHKLMSIKGNIPGLSEQRWKDIEKRLNRVRPRLRKLESWRHWGTTQARQDLIEQVRQLIDPGLHPEKISTQVQRAREQWHAWDKSGDQPARELWVEFDRACEEAYKPCIAHFEKLKQQRRENLGQRRALIDSLNARYEATDWKHPDWRDIDKFIRHARRDFYKAGNIDYKHRKPLARALEEALGKFEEQLSGERERSIKARERLIADIEALGEVASLRDALDRLEDCKKQWTITVTGKRDLENRLWKRFQAACDSIYRRRDAERKEQADEREANLKLKQALIDELEQAAAAADEELLANAAAIGRIRNRWQEIGWIPRRHEGGLESRWRTAQKHFSSALKAAETRARDSELDNIAKRAALCHQWEQATLAGSAPDADSIEAEWHSLPALSAAGTETIRRRYSQVLAPPDDTTLTENLATKQDACLRLEVLLDLESPQEYQAERMAYQIERLNASLKKELDTQDSSEDLLLTALTTGPVPATAADVIERRIAGCLARYKDRS